MSLYFMAISSHEERDAKEFSIGRKIKLLIVLNEKKLFPKYVKLEKCFTKRKLRDLYLKYCTCRKWAKDTVVLSLKIKGG